MKLYLSSYFLGNDPSKFAALFTSNKKVAIIMNAADVYDPATRPYYLKKEIVSLAEIGLEGEELDLRDYFDDRDKLAARLGQYGGVWVRGGNSFVLRRALSQSGFDQLAPPLIRNNQLVYGGFSAGAAVATKSLKGIELVDDPNLIPDSYDTRIIWKGLGLYDKSIAPHFKSDHPASPAIDKVVAYFDETGMSYITLHDGEVIVVSD